MNWTEALEIVVGRTGHEAYRAACADDHPQHEVWRARMVAKATGIKSDPAYPSLGTMAVNAARAAAGFVASGFAIASEEEQARRLAVCRECEYFRPEHVRCAKCSCFINLKKRIQSSHCPIGKW